MDYIEAEGDSIDQAIQNALKELGVAREKVTIDVLSEGRKGILGFGAQKARVRARLRQSAAAEVKDAEPGSAAGEAPMTREEIAAVAEKAQTVLSEILQRMGVEASVARRAEGAETILDIRTDNSGLLIGRKGQTLEALQYLVTRIAGERSGAEGPHIVIDVENYRERRRKSLQDMALRLGEKAKRQRQTVTVDALSAADRRIVHEALQDDPWLTTKSLGQGSYRRLLIVPEGDRKKKEGAKPAPRETAK